ncbi:MAG: hypothetical protein DRQ42_06105 [Gammaproteobacteria bacterium]|nr:MAG: hypothetical protein DRQ42_06105 [Gammaproteobacteria bacterium]
MATKYSKKVQVTLTEADFATLEELVGSSRLTTGQMASTLLEDALADHRTATVDDTPVSAVA